MSKDGSAEHESVESEDEDITSIEMKNERDKFLVFKSELSRFNFNEHRMKLGKRLIVP